MRFFRRIAGFLGLSNDHNNNNNNQEEEQEEDDQQQQHHHHQQQQQPRVPPNFQETGLPRKGFGVTVQVAVDRAHLPPLLTPCSSGDGGVQGLGWHAKRLRIDEDGDVADEFLDEVLPETSFSVGDQHKQWPKFEAKHSTRPAKIKKQMMSDDGRIQQCVEYQGTLQWV